MLEFFNHEILQYPPLLAEGGEMRSGTKFDLVKCFLPDSTASIIDTKPKAAEVVLECSVLLDLVKPKKNQLFEDYSFELFYPQICKYQQLCVAYSVDVVFDTYKENILKMTSRVKRREGVSRKVQEISVAPKNWKGFLHLDQNKTELLRFLCKTVISLGREDKTLVCVCVWLCVCVCVCVCVYDDTCISSNGDL